MYPRKVGKPQALKAARRHAKTATDRAAILECLKRRLPALQEQFRADGDFRPYPERWLNQTPWLDPEETARPVLDHIPNTKTIDEAVRMLYGEGSGDAHN